MIDWVTIIVVLAAALVILAIVLSLASFFIRLYQRLMKLIIYAAIALTAFVVIAMVSLGVWIVYF